MAVEIRVPQMGESVTEAVVGQWLKKEGDAVKPGEAVVNLETDKVAVDVPAEEPGVLERIVQQEGATVHVGDLLATMFTGAATSHAITPARAEAALSSGAEAPASIPSGNGAEGPAAAPAALPTPTSAATSRQGEVPSRFVEEAPAQEAPAAATGDRARGTPVAERLARANNVDLAQVSGSGARGRVTKDDVAAYMERAPASPVTPTAPSPAPQSRGPLGGSQPSPRPIAAPSTPSPFTALLSQPDREERVRISPRRKTIARRLVEAQQTAAMLTTFNEVDMSAVMEVRKRRRDTFKERHGVGLGFMSFFTKATVGALKVFPRLNAEIQGDEFVLKRYYDIGIAVGAEEGLVVPVLRAADRKSFAEIEREIAAMAGRARENKLTLAELQGGTFTITNGGIFGSLLSTPILNTPEVGILGMHKIEERPIALGGQVVIRPMMYLALTYDHRIVDGREAVQFLVRIKELIEDPETLLLEG
jgi:2-oxoglutarate dehydrogenase E2 component (dihydrolipoamide succinyltransferase)